MLPKCFNRPRRAALWRNLQPSDIEWISETFQSAAPGRALEVWYFNLVSVQGSRFQSAAPGRALEAQLQ